MEKNNGQLIAIAKVINIVSLNMFNWTNTRDNPIYFLVGECWLCVLKKVYLIKKTPNGIFCRMVITFQNQKIALAFFFSYSFHIWSTTWRKIFCATPTLFVWIWTKKKPNEHLVDAFRMNDVWPGVTSYTFSALSISFSIVFDKTFENIIQFVEFQEYINVYIWA